MKLPNTFARAGFSLLEVVITIGIFVCILSFSLPYNINAMRASALHQAQSTIVELLNETRNRAVNGVHNLPHGMYLYSNRVTLFKGSTYDGESHDNIQYELVDGVQSVGTTTVIFEPYSGRILNPGVIVLSTGKTSTVIELNHEGTISN